MEFTSDGFLIDFWCYNRQGEKVYPCLFKPRGAAHKKLYVTLTEDRGDYQQMDLDDFLLRLSNGSFDEKGRIRMKAREGLGRQSAHGFSIRKGEMSDRLQVELTRLRSLNRCHK